MCDICAGRTGSATASMAAAKASTARMATATSTTATGIISAVGTRSARTTSAGENFLVRRTRCCLECLEGISNIRLQ